MISKLYILWLVTLLAITGCSANKSLYYQGKAAYDGGDFDLAAQLWQQSLSNPKSLNALGQLSEQGLGATPLDTKRASTLYMQATRQGIHEAASNLGALLVKEGYQKDGILWLRYAARWGIRSAQIKLYNLGQSIPYTDLSAAATAYDELPYDEMKQKRKAFVEQSYDNFILSLSEAKERLSLSD